MSTIEHLTAADRAAVRCLLLEAYADYAKRIGPGASVRLGFTVTGDLPMNFGLRYWRFRRSLGGG